MGTAALAKVVVATALAASTEAWERLRERKLPEAYQAAYAEEPEYPYESAVERKASRARRNRREAHAWVELARRVA